MPVDAPTGVRVKAADGQAVLTWTDHSRDGAEYIVERRAPGERFKSVAHVPAGTFVYRDEALSPGVAYAYRVMAMTGSDPWAGTYSAEATLTAP